MRPKIIAGNWKMYKDLHASSELIASVVSRVDFDLDNVRVVVCPPFTSLELAHRLLEGSPIALGAQNMYTEDEGAFTGEISPKMLLAAGCTYVIIGHSERRQYFGETNVSVNAKVRKALAAGLTPIACVGESLEEREKGITEQVVGTQVKALFKEISEADASRVVIAYEPIWAIGTGKTATPAQAQEVHQFIRKIVAQLYSWPTADKIVIQYGGSVKPENAVDLLKQPDIDGALVGGACLKAETFVPIIRAAVKT
ncbi:MAG: triose-phosphate isomerase [Ignavibacteria bacterium RIFCSPLOWO2_02_FULL_55_14]|nr:MAG: triose-phosphate isomerase [Ignavibacteria bacterium GWC2_56_12]OGU65172.1 MAG: triose-phosphate isomerase [Ignavibacteria bacterium RIFCSPHIGHO2_02_FULL_56_12]OGU71731.1 MAG: triose-phosphate isomerase [Ignavibacteria bacterium RIFCSPLOWO2_02_FULL_55_14]OGU73701.1 MAG: triose-phosphate isomerase [Ignavibacteria bacterium RIFCSPLOWO2_12_FULL_56_21]